jgi:hypothetical protein
MKAWSHRLVTNSNCIASGRMGLRLCTLRSDSRHRGSAELQELTTFHCCSPTLTGLGALYRDLKLGEFLM